MGGIKVDPMTQQTTVKGLFAAGEVSSGLHGANRLGGNSLTDLIVFGKLAGEYAAEDAKSIAETQEIPETELKQAVTDALDPFDSSKSLDPYEVHDELKKTMEEYVGIIRTEDRLKEGIQKLEALKEKVKQTKATGSRIYNPGWHLAISLRHMVNTGLAIAHAALARKESRGAHTRDDFPETKEELRNILYLIKLEDGKFIINEETYPPMSDELKKIMEGEVS
jgi:succinate dehydrogenase / fumarate reductase flavoprotein subunit